MTTPADPARSGFFEGLDLSTVPRWRSIAELNALSFQAFQEQNMDNGPSDDGWKATRWWRVTYADGRVYGEESARPGALQIWLETSNEGEARRAVETCPSGGVLHRFYEHTASEWRLMTND